MTLMFNGTWQWTTEQVQIEITLRTSKHEIRLISAIKFIARRCMGLLTIGIIGIALIRNVIVFLTKTEKVIMSWILYVRSQKRAC